MCMGAWRPIRSQVRPCVAGRLTASTNRITMNNDRLNNSLLYVLNFEFKLGEPWPFNNVSSYCCRRQIIPTENCINKSRDIS